MRRGKRKFENVKSAGRGAWIPRKPVKEATLGMTGESIVMSAPNKTES